MVDEVGVTDSRGLGKGHSVINKLFGHILKKEKRLNVKLWVRKWRKIRWTFAFRLNDIYM